MLVKNSISSLCHRMRGCGLYRRGSVSNFVGQFVDANFNTKVRERSHQFGIKFRNRPWNEAYFFLRTIARRCAQHMIQKIKIEVLTRPSRARSTRDIARQI